jgi:HEAT repeat protein
VHAEVTGAAHSGVGVSIGHAARSATPALETLSSVTRSALRPESVSYVLGLDDPFLVQRMLLMLVDEHPAVPPGLLAPLTGHANLAVRLTAVAVLSGWADPQSRAILGRFASDPSLVVRERALRALRNSASEAGPPATVAMPLLVDTRRGVWWTRHRLGQWFGVLAALAVVRRVAEVTWQRLGA